MGGELAASNGGGTSKSPSKVAAGLGDDVAGARVGAWSTAVVCVDDGVSSFAAPAHRRRSGESRRVIASPEPTADAREVASVAECSVVTRSTLARTTSCPVISSTPTRIGTSDNQKLWIGATINGDVTTSGSSSADPPPPASSVGVIIPGAAQSSSSGGPRRVIAGLEPVSRRGTVACAPVVVRPSVASWFARL